MTCKEAIDDYVKLMNELAETRKCEGITSMIAKARLNKGNAVNNKGEN